MKVFTPADTQNGIPFLYSTTPPRADSDPDKILRAAVRLAERVQALKISGLVVYDVQDESERTAEPRPFPFLPTIESKSYSERLSELIDAPVITYKCVASMSEAQWHAWLQQFVLSGTLKALSLVGKASSLGGHRGISLSRAIAIAAAEQSDLTLGGVVIPERNSPERNEAARLLFKAKLGCSYFISQAVFSAEPVIALIHQYSAMCQNQNVPPDPIYLTFAPCGNAKTIAFMRWLGISLPLQTEALILKAESPLTKSIEICESNLANILSECTACGVPLGVNVESVSNRKDEIAASVDLLQRLQSRCNV